MVKQQPEQFPADVRERACSALAGAFGNTPVAAITRISGGATTAYTYRVEVGDRSFLLRMEGDPSPLRNPHQYTSMRIAAEAGISPQIRFLDEASRAVVIDFIEQRPLGSFPGGPTALAKSLGSLIKTVQGTEAFPYFIPYPEIVARLFRHVRRTGLFSEGCLDPHFERLEQLRQAYDVGSRSLVSSHNDFIPSNTLFDGERFWLIDWESAYQNDPFVDVTLVLDTIVRSPDLEPFLLEGWLSRKLDEEDYSRLAVVRALTRLYYAGVSLSASAAAGFVAGDNDLSAPTVLEFERRIASGQLRRGSPETRHILGKMFLASFMTGVDPPGLSAAV